MQIQFGESLFVVWSRLIAAVALFVSLGFLAFACDYFRESLDGTLAATVMLLVAGLERWPLASPQGAISHVIPIIGRQTPPPLPPGQPLHLLPLLCSFVFTETFFFIPRRPHL